jgi:hypothetical protein
MTIIGNSLFNAGATVDTSKDGSAASFQAAIGTTYEIDLSLNDSSGETVVTFPSSPTRGDAFAVVITGTGTERVVSFTGTVSGASATAAYGLSRTAQYAIFRYFNATVGWLMHTNKHDVNNTIANGNTNLVLGSDNTCDARSTNGSMCVGHNNSATGYVDNVIVGTANSSNTINTVTMGSNCTTSGYLGCAFGLNASGTGQGGQAFGYSVTASGTQKSCAFGYESTASGNEAAAFGVGCTATGDKSSAFGHKSEATTLNSQVFGRQNFTGVATGLACVGIGILNNNSGGTLNIGTGVITGTVVSATTVGNLSTAVGVENWSSGDQSTAVGYKNTASGYIASAFGYYNTASNDYANAIGYANTASGTYNSAAVGNSNTASGSSSSAFGNNNTASGYCSSAIGYLNESSGSRSSAIGFRAKTTIANTFEAGYWSDSSTRGGAVRADSTGLVQFTIEDSATPPADGGATAGSEVAGNLGRGMFTIHKNGASVTLYYNNAGTIESVNLGTLV